MPGRQASDRSVRDISGVVLLALGSTLMVVYAGDFAWRLAETWSSPLSVYAGLGMASLNAFQAVAFDHSPFLPIALRMLVLFSAFTMTLIGIVLLPKRTTGMTAPGLRSLSALPKGDQ